MRLIQKVGVWLLKVAAVRQLELNEVVKVRSWLFAYAIMAILLISAVLPSSVESVNETSTSGFEGIGENLFYNIRSSIFNWFIKTEETLKSAFVKNVKIYEAETKKYGRYHKERNDALNRSYLNDSEPPFNSSICPETTPITVSTRFTFCSCGDGICASYEDKCNCVKDCGSCQDGTVCIRGKCSEYAPNLCMNTVCEEGERETCPWDCKIYMITEEEERLDEEEINLIRTRAKEKTKSFVEKHGEVFVESENRTAARTLPETVRK